MDYARCIYLAYLSSKDGGNRKAYETCLKLSLETQKRRLVKEGAVAYILKRQ